MPGPQADADIKAEQAALAHMTERVKAAEEKALNACVHFAGLVLAFGEAARMAASNAAARGDAAQVEVDDAPAVLVATVINALGEVAEGLSPTSVARVERLIYLLDEFRIE